MKAKNNNQFRDLVINAAMVIEGIAKNQNLTLSQKAILVMERMGNVIVDLSKLLEGIHEDSNDS